MSVWHVELWSDLLVRLEQEQLPLQCVLARCHALEGGLDLAVSPRGVVRGERERVSVNRGGIMELMEAWLSLMF